MTFSPSGHWGGVGAPTRIWVGTDGGVASSTNGGTTFANLNEGIATNLFLGIDIGRGSAAICAGSIVCTAACRHRHAGDAMFDQKFDQMGKTLRCGQQK